ncbi:hypothetical protein [Actinokineospora xionganensis]|uniref:WXG100 family type VII secretion target n=1 Tax=Actinokineospora xionganensis TaxID=2684470 RepID=A0ABR7L9I1_9PSEU|nr:hypothetical protein [Actinokineospora xionganensis]MBC6449232.1 hypothetical protein [Actinokineospora xionganensis]
MSGLGYIQGTGHAANLSTAMNDFHEALTYRWREEITQKIMAAEHDYPTRVARSGSPMAAPLWNYSSASAACHLRGVNAGCSYVDWVEGGQEGDLRSVTCEGKTGADEGGVDLVGPDGQPETVPPNIQCGMGSILEAVENWAWGEREHTYYELPLFDMHDVGALEIAHDHFLTIGAQLGLEAGAGSSADTGSFRSMSERELVGKVQDVSGERGQGQDWWTGWTGLAASRAKAGFFDSCAPTINNQSGIAGSLANLYAARGAIIEKGRNDALYWIQWATKSLKEKQTISTNLVYGWKTVQGIGTAITISGGWSGVGAAVGAAVILTGFIGENLIPNVTSEGHKHGLVEVVETLNTKINELNSAVNGLELEYSNEVAELQDTIFGIHSFNLELYDLTQNSADGDHEGSGDGYTANVEDILKIGQACYEAGDLYAGLLSTIAATSSADNHLADKDGAATSGDTALLAVRTMFEGFLRTAAARYEVAGDQTKAAAEAYAKVETDQQAAYDRITDDWTAAGVGVDDPDFDENAEAGATDRGPDKPFGGHPSQGGGNAPGTGDGEDYETN